MADRHARDKMRKFSRNNDIKRCCACGNQRALKNKINAIGKNQWRAQVESVRVLEDQEERRALIQNQRSHEKWQKKHCAPK
jgi:hypothetical protein